MLNYLSKITKHLIKFKFKVGQYIIAVQYISEVFNLEDILIQQIEIILVSHHETLATIMIMMTMMMNPREVRVRYQRVML